MPFNKTAGIIALALVMACIPVGGVRGDQAAADRGKYIFDAGGCASCHTDEKGGGAPLSGGTALETPFGTFYAPNITPDPDHGIGRWTAQEFLRAMREGVAPDGRHYYPTFPYTSHAACRIAVHGREVAQSESFEARVDFRTVEVVKDCNLVPSGGGPIDGGRHGSPMSTPYVQNEHGDFPTFRHRVNT